MIEPVVDAFTPSKPRRRLGRKSRIILAIFGLCLLWLVMVLPPPLWYRWNDPGETAFMAMRRHDHPENFASRKYQPIPFVTIPNNIREAVMIGEDQRFYQHGGLDPVQIRIAMGYPRQNFAWSSARDRGDLWKAIKGLWHHRTSVRGASTITQQLAKNLYLSPSRNPFRKVKELLLTWRLEFCLSKDRILELYLNSVEMGDEVWGIEAASQKYFGKPARKLSDYEAATLAGLLPFPLSSNPLRRPGRMAWRRDLILRRMHGDSVEIPAGPVTDSTTADSTGTR